ncbi:hypothetical protein Hamer_G024478 [Homarus americanus]|uniref:Uncharacterized protein n=1 Tax=Homarus americanus TaxID=6706 RepID=A0A8J5JNQ9_HOMAM|nr:hypothetical protein Hamer_G024478 [Homarus americanus]
MGTRVVLCPRARLLKASSTQHQQHTAPAAQRHGAACSLRGGPTCHALAGLLLGAVHSQLPLPLVSRKEGGVFQPPDDAPK